ncbi:MAG: hypothetical protein K5648_03870 [Erysipelotrichaceae bacterium]|nr:hypothetical protein [Erysipelotrichaceae bacterium]
MLKKFLLIALLMFEPIRINNGYDQNTRITFTGIGETCYGTLLSKTSVSGTWSSNLSLPLNAPDQVIAFFEGYEDADSYFYLNYFQDISEGMLYWPFYPPEDFKILLYYPDSDSFIVSDAPIRRYALSSTYHAVIENGSMSVSRNYDHMRMALITLSRIVLCTLTALAVTFLFYRPGKKDLKPVLSSNLLYQLLLHLIISLYSYKNGFSIVEYFLFLWIPTLLFAFFQGYLYKTKTYTLASPYFCALASQFAAYAAGLLLVDVFPAMFTIF